MPSPRAVAGLDAPAHGDHLGANDVHADAAAGELGHGVGGGKAGREDQVGELGVAGLGGRVDEVLGLGLGADPVEIEAGAVVAELDADFVAFVRKRDDDRSGRILARGRARRRCLDAVRDAVAQQVLEGARHPVEDAAIDLDRAADDVEADLLAAFLGGEADDPVEAVGQALELDHARAQQVVLQVARETRLGDQLVFGRLQRALQRALDGGDVVDRLRHHPRQLLEAREAVELERVERLRRRLRGLEARGHLHLALQLDVAQLAAQPLEVLGEVGERSLDLADARLDARAGDADLAGLVDEAVEQRRAHAHGRLRREHALDRPGGSGRIREAGPVDLRGLDRGLVGRRARFGTAAPWRLDPVPVRAAARPRRPAPRPARPARDSPPAGR